MAWRTDGGLERAVQILGDPVMKCIPQEIALSYLFYVYALVGDSSVLFFLASVELLVHGVPTF